MVGRIAWISGFFFTVLLAGSETPGPDEPTIPREIEEQIRIFEAWDRENTPPAGAVLFMGDGDVDQWPTRVTFAQHPVINRGLSGASAAVLALCVERLVTPYAPRVIVYAAGGQDVAEGRDPQAICGDVAVFIKRVRAGAPRVPIVLLAVKPTPRLDAELESARRRTNELLAAMSERDVALYFVDTSIVLLDPQGRCIASLYDAESGLLNETGYRLWSLLLTPTLQRCLQTGPETGAATSPTGAAAVGDFEYVASKSSKTFHKSTCSAARRITEANLVRFPSREAAARSGRKPFKLCNP